MAMWQWPGVKRRPPRNRWSLLRHSAIRSPDLGRGAAKLAAVCLGLGLFGCVTGEKLYEPKATVWRAPLAGEPPRGDPGMRIVDEPPKYVGRLAREMVNEERDIVIIDPVIVRGQLFPAGTGKWHLRDLQERIAQGGVGATLGVDMLVMVDSLGLGANEWEGPKSHYSISARLLDLDSGAATLLGSEASGVVKDRWFLVAIQLVPSAGPPAIRELARALVRDIRLARPQGPVRVSMLAVASPL